MTKIEETIAQLLRLAEDQAGTPEGELAARRAEGARKCIEMMRAAVISETVVDEPDAFLADVVIYTGDRPLNELGWLTFDLTQPTAQIPCVECGGSGWWGFGPPGTEGDCVTCKATGRLTIGLW